MLYSREIPCLMEDSAVALGLFDGLHLGHRAVIAGAVESGLLPVVFTFSFDTLELATKADFANILSNRRKQAVLEKLGVKAVCDPLFSSFRDMEPEDFFREILLKRLKAAAIFCGADFRFGNKARGDTALLGKLCRETGVAFHSVLPVLDEGVPISSTRIRQLLREGEMEEAARLLGEPYAIDYPVAHGRQLGRTMGYPTINQLYPPEDLLPLRGVYVSRAWVEGRAYQGVTNIGVKPTLGGLDAPSAETTLLDFSGDLYGRRVPLQLLHFLRPERQFPSVEALFWQVAADVAACREHF